MYKFVKTMSRTMGRLGLRDIYIHHSIPFLRLTEKKKKRNTYIGERRIITARMHWNLRSSLILTVRTVNVVTARHAGMRYIIFPLLALEERINLRATNPFIYTRIVNFVLVYHLVITAYFYFEQYDSCTVHHVIKSIIIFLCAKFFIFLCKRNIYLC